MSDLLHNLGAGTAGFELLGVVLGALLIMIGAAILLAVLTGRLAADTDSGASRLLPTLAEDVLDADLQHIYHRSMWLDTLVAEYHAPLSSPTGTRLGRLVRRQLVALQAERFAAEQSDEGEPPAGEARLHLVKQVVEEALDRVDAAGRQARANEELSEALAALSERLDSA